MNRKSYIAIVECTPMGYEHRKTKSWRVDGRGVGNVLGWIQWFGRWRQYAFSPNTRTVYSAGCLEDIAAFCARANHEHRASLKARKQ